MGSMRKWSAAMALALGSIASSIAAAGTITYYHHDLLGSPVAATNASGLVIWRESYRPYGERIKNEASSAENKVWYASRRQDVETGLVYMGARYYDPVVGRFMGIDPKLFREDDVHSFNRYAYANNNPYRYIDRDGRETGTAYQRGYALPIPRFDREAGLESVCVECALLIAERVPSAVRALMATKRGEQAPETPSSVEKPNGIPENWIEGPLGDGGRREWVNPANSHDRIRSYPGNPESSNPAQQKPYVKDVRDGNKWLDVNGDRIEGARGRNSPDTHVPTKDYKFPER